MEQRNCGVQFYFYIVNGTYEHLSTNYDQINDFSFVHFSLLKYFCLFFIQVVTLCTSFPCGIFFHSLLDIEFEILLSGVINLRIDNVNVLSQNHYNNPENILSAK